MSIVESSAPPSVPQESSEPGVPTIEDDKPFDSASLAERIQRLLNTSAPEFPPPEPSPQPTVDIPVDERKEAADLGEPSPRPAFPPPPRHPALASDPKLVTLLSSPAVMNGNDKGKGKEDGAGQSVWDALEKLKAQIPWINRDQTEELNNKEKVKDEKNADTAGGNEDVLDDDESGVMVYGPLFPSTDPVAAASDVELAKSELVPVSEHHGHLFHTAKSATSQTPQTTSKPSLLEAHQDKIDALRNKVEGMWPFAKSTENLKADSEGESTVSSTRIHFQPVTENARKKRVWVPSREKISVQVMWWGYRM